MSILILHVLLTLLHFQSIKVLCGIGTCDACCNGSIRISHCQYHIHTIKRVTICFGNIIFHFKKEMSLNTSFKYSFYLSLKNTLYYTFQFSTVIYAYNVAWETK